MADPEAARLTQLRNIQAKTGQTLAQMHAVVAQSGLEKVGERRTLLMERFKLGYGDANTVALFYGKPPPHLDSDAPTAAPAQADDPLDAIYVGAKAPLRTLHLAVLEKIRGLGPFDEAPKKNYISLRRKKQFAMLGPATKDLLELGLNIKSLAASPRLKAMPPGGMCQYTVRIGSPADIDRELMGWIQSAYDAAA